MSAPKQVFKWDESRGAVVPAFSLVQPEVDAPYVQGDEIPATVSHATDEGLVFTSKQKLNEHYKLHGFECTGGAHHTGRAAGPQRKAFESDAERSRKANWGMLRVDPEIRATVMREQQKVAWGMAPLTEREKERCSQEERIYKDYLKRRRA